MILTKNQVLIVGFEDLEALRIVASLGSLDVDLHYSLWNHELVDLVASREFDAILIPHPAEPPDLTSFLEALRDEESPSRRAGLIMLVDSADLERSSKFLDQGVNRLIELDGLPDALTDSLLTLLAVARRYQLRAPVELRTELDDMPIEVFCNTENISMSGMLVSCSKRIPVGSSLEFAMVAPGEEEHIHGTAKVTRWTDPRREHVIGIGTRFQSLSDGDRARLRSIIDRHIVALSDLDEAAPSDGSLLN